MSSPDEIAAAFSKVDELLVAATADRSIDLEAADTDLAVLVLSWARS